MLFLLTGHAADRYDRRNVLRICQTVETLAVGFLAWGTLAGWITREAILAASLAIGAARAFEAPALLILLSPLLPRLRERRKELAVEEAN